jgi:hypothetical protein
LPVPPGRNRTWFCYPSAKEASMAKTYDLNAKKEELGKMAERAATAVAENAPKRQVSYGLGAFSLALGLGELLLTRKLARSSGIGSQFSPVLRTFGMREITSGVGLPTGKKEQAWLWSRVVGDALDVGFLTYAFWKEKDAEKRARIALSAAAVAPVVALDIVNVLRRDQGKVSQAA